MDVDRHGAALDHDVGRATQRSEVERIEGDGLLAAVVRHVPQAPVRAGDVVDERADPSGGGPLRRLDEDDLGTELREQEPCELATPVGQIEHSIR